MADDTSLVGKVKQKLIETKQKWAGEGRLLTGESGDAAVDRLPPGQREVQNWPVLDLGVQPEVPTAKWRLDVGGLVEAPLSWSWTDFKAQSQATIVSDIHCVTAWSRFNNTWEGVATRQRRVVENGVLTGYFLGSYSARKLGMQTTGNAGGCHNLILADTGEDFAALLKKTGRGLLVTELMGQGINMVTGDYSRGAAGFWIENGEIAYPVHEITIAGNLKDIFRGMVAAGTDVLKRGSKHCGSILIDRMTIAGD